MHRIPYSVQEIQYLDKMLQIGASPTAIIKTYNKQFGTNRTAIALINVMSILRRGEALTERSGRARYKKYQTMLQGGGKPTNALALDFSAVQGKEPTYDVLFSVKFANGHDKQDIDILNQMIAELPNAFMAAVKSKTGRDVTIER